MATTRMRYPVDDKELLFCLPEQWIAYWVAALELARAAWRDGMKWRSWGWMTDWKKKEGSDF